MYQLLLFVHIVCAVLWVGGSFYVQALAVVVNRSGDPSELPRLGLHIELIGNWVFVPAAALLLVSGLAMTAQSWSFGQTWIVVSLILWMFSAVAGAAYLAPRARRASALFEAEGPSSVVARRLTDRMFLVSRLELVSFAVVIALMVFKPNL